MSIEPLAEEDASAMAFEDLLADWTGPSSATEKAKYETARSG